MLLKFRHGTLKALARGIVGQSKRVSRLLLRKSQDNNRKYETGIARNDVAQNAQAICKWFA